MLHRADRSIKKLLFVLFLLFNLGCGILYEGNDKINESKTLYPAGQHSIGSFKFVNAVNKGDCNKTLFVTIEVQAPRRFNNAARICSEKVNKDLEEEFEKMIPDPQAHVLNFFVNASNIISITQKHVTENVKDITEKIIEKKGESIFDNIVVNVVYVGGMRDYAQKMIKDLMGAEIKVNEICFDPFEKGVGHGNDFKVEENWQNSHLKNFYTSKDEYVEDEGPFKQLIEYLKKKDDKKYQSLNGKTEKEGFVSELKKLDPTKKDEDVVKILKFLEDKQQKYILYISEDLKEIALMSVEEAAKKIVAGNFDLKQ